MKKYKLYSVMLCVSVLISFVGCGSTQEPTDTTQPKQTVTADVTSIENTSDDITAETTGITVTENSESSAKLEISKKVDTTAAVTTTQTNLAPTENPIITTTQKSKPIETTTKPKPTETTTKPITTTEPQKDFDINYWIEYAKSYAKSKGLNLNPQATECWDNPISAGVNCKNTEADIKSRLNRYSRDEDITDVWIWAEKTSDNHYDLYIGYA